MVLIAGGDSSGGALSSIEIYDPASNSFSHAGTMSSPRSHHAAALLPDGRVLLVGGTDGNQALATSEIFNPASGSVSAGPSMAAARSNASITQLIDGRLLVAGGNNGGGDLASAEIYSNGGFSSAGDSMSTPRSGHLAFLLKENNGVLIVGGSSGGSAVGSAEIYYPWSKSFVSTGSMSVGRANASGSTLNADGRLLVSGGNGQAGSEVYGFSTLRTDGIDYAPGDIVTVTGEGWQPGETVTLTFHEVNSPCPDKTLTATADSSGRILNTEFSPDQHDIGITFELTAKGTRSQAQTTFKDGANDSLESTPNNYNLTLHPGDPIPAGRSFTYSVSEGTNRHVTFPITGSVSYTGAFGSADKTSITLTSYTSTAVVTVSGNVPCSQAIGNVGLQVKVNFPNSGNSANLSPNQSTDNINITVANPPAASCDAGAPDTSITAHPNDPTNSTTATFSFTGTDNITTPANLTFECKLDAAAFASCGSPIVYNGPLAAGSHTFQVRAKDQAGNVDATPASFTWTIDLALPDTTITSGAPSGTSPTFTFTGTDNLTPAANLTFECKIDAAAFAACTSPKSYSGLSAGSHTFHVRAKDAAGNVDPSPASETWTTDTTPPEITPNITGTLGSNNWYTSDVTVSWSTVDNESDITSSTGCTASTLNTDTAGKTFTCTATSAGGTSTESVTIKRDATAPTLSLEFTPDSPDGNNGWWKTTGGVGFKWTCADNVSGIDAAFNGGCPAVLTGTVTDQGTTNFTRQVKDQAGNLSVEVNRSLKVDNIAPTVNAAIAPAAPASTGWYNIATGAPTVSFTCSDTGSGLAGTCPANELVPEGANQTVSRDVSDQAGNQSTAEKKGINVDLTAPILGLVLAPDGPDGSNGWWKTAGGVGFAWACSDATSGVDATFDGGCPAPLNGVITAQGTTNFADQVRDVAGNTSVAVNRSMKLDNVAPVISITAPLALTLPQGYVLNAVLKSGYGCTDATSGVSICDGTLPSGSNFDTSGSDFDPVALGINKSFKVNAEDQAGNTAVQTNNYNVIYASGIACLGNIGHAILQPINADGTSVFKQGSTVPAKFRVCDANGVSIGALGTVSNFRLVQTAAGTVTIVDEAVDSTTPDTAFRWDPTAQQWIFNVTTKPLRANLTYYYSIYLNDGTNIPFLYGLR